MSSKRHSTAPPVAKPPTSLSSSLTIADNVSITGTHPIRINSHTIVHPRTKLSSAHGPITIGSSCMISERVILSPTVKGLVIENYVVVEVGGVIEAQSIGEGTVIEVNARVGKDAIIGKHCKIGALCEVVSGEVVPDFTVIYGDGLRRLDRGNVEDLKLKMLERQVGVLRKLIPSKPEKYL